MITAKPFLLYNFAANAVYVYSTFGALQLAALRLTCERYTPGDKKMSMQRMVKNNVNVGVIINN
ncbi:MAG: hypothetical protein ABIU77_12265 [Ferruginibacter sp.]